jgi:hypothetical protein
MNLCEIDRAVLAAEKAGKEWHTVRGIRSRRRFLKRAQAGTLAGGALTQLPDR